MSCNGNVESGIVGVAYDGFPFYGPMQYYSEREGKVYKDPSRCSDCKLMQLNAVQTDACGGIEVADGDPQEGGQYRYIVSNIFPYNLQESSTMTYGPENQSRKLFLAKCRTLKVLSW